MGFSLKIRVWVWSRAQNLLKVSGIAGAKRNFFPRRTGEVRVSGKVRRGESVSGEVPVGFLGTSLSWVPCLLTLL